MSMLIPARIIPPTITISVGATLPAEGICGTAKGVAEMAALLVFGSWVSCDLLGLGLLMVIVATQLGGVSLHFPLLRRTRSEAR